MNAVDSVHLVIWDAQSTDDRDREIYTDRKPPNAWIVSVS